MVALQTGGHELIRALCWPTASQIMRENHLRFDDTTLDLCRRMSVALGYIHASRAVGSVTRAGI